MRSSDYLVILLYEIERDIRVGLEFYYTGSQELRTGDILNQEEHHRKKTFKEEYLKMLRDFSITYDSRYLFHFDEGGV